MLREEQRMGYAIQMWQTLKKFRGDYDVFAKETVPLLLVLSGQAEIANCWADDGDACKQQALKVYLKLRQRGSSYTPDDGLLFCLWVTTMIPVMVVIIDGQHRLGTSVIERNPLDGGPFPGRFFPTKILGDLNVEDITRIQTRKCTSSQFLIQIFVFIIVHIQSASYDSIIVRFLFVQA